MNSLVPSQALRVGVIGLGRAFTLMLPTFVADGRVRLVAACDPMPEARAQFEKDFAAPTCVDAAQLCARPDVDAVYIASPHQLHAEHVLLAARHGKHVLVEKPMAISLDACTRMIEACDQAGVVLVVGHSHSFNQPIAKTMALIRSGQFGRVRMVHALNYTDFLYRPRRPEELDTAQGGGVVFSQAAHQIDIVRLLCGGRVRQLSAQIGRWDVERPTEGAYSALLQFEDGAFASVTYSGYAHFNSDAWMEGVGELGLPQAQDKHAQTRLNLRRVAAQATEAAAKAARNYGGAAWLAPKAGQQPAHQHFGPLIVSCEHADLRPTPTGIHIDSHEGYRFEALPAPTVPRQEVVDEWLAAITYRQAPVHSGAWARATLATCLAMLTSAQQQAPVYPAFQVGVGELL
jgi:phthalate 4,5-cis-dihydrodiol dehydrogenase